LLTVLRGETPDCVPVAPDFSNMIPARLTGKPFWDLYLYNDPPIWEAYIACAKHFGIDALMDGYFPLHFPEDDSADVPPWEYFIVHRDNERIVTQGSFVEDGTRRWADTVHVFYVADPPTYHVPPAKLGMPPEPEDFAPLENVQPVDRGPEGLKRVKTLMGDQGLVGVWLCSSVAFPSEAAIMQYYEQPEMHEQWARERVEWTEARFARIMAMDVRPDFLCVGGSGTLVFQTEEMFRRVAFPAVKRGIELAGQAGIPTHMHSCGRETALVRMMAAGTGLTVIDPLEKPPMGDCDLAALKQRYGQDLTLKGNLHTSRDMLGSEEHVVAASKEAIDAAAEGGRFILSTGDQCGRDTPDENLRAMIETARTYGRY
jgi:uroporphyrinogen decarboxylase